MTRTSVALISGIKTINLLIQQVIAGLSTGGVYACMALAIVMIYQAIDHLNFAQGEMAMFSTFIAWQLLQWGLPYWLTFFLTIVISFLGGVVIERLVFKPLKNAPVLSHIVVFIALLGILNSAGGFYLGFHNQGLSKPVWYQAAVRAEHHFDARRRHDRGHQYLADAAVVFFRYTRVGFAMRAAAANSESARLVGIRVGWMIALGWGMAAAIGAVAGMMIAPVVFLEPNMMLPILLYGFAGAVVGV